MENHPGNLQIKRRLGTHLPETPEGFESAERGVHEELLMSTQEFVLSKHPQTWRKIDNL
jgi:hypothetical protein